MTQHLTNEELLDYLHGALTPQQDAAAYAHMETCSQCRSDYDAEARIGEMLRGHARASERELPATLKAEIWSRIRDSQPSAASRLLGWLRPAIAIPVAAAIALAAYFGTTMSNPGAPAIEAAYYLQDHAALNSTIPFNDHGSLTPVDMETAAASGTHETAVNVQAASYTADANQ